MDSDIFKLFDSFFIFIVYFLLYDNCIVNMYIFYLVVVGPHQLYRSGKWLVLVETTGSTPNHKCPSLISSAKPQGRFH